MELRGTIGFLGYGNMAAAILEGLIEAGVVAGKHAIIYDPVEARQQAAAAIGVNVAPDPAAVAGGCETLVLAVKPQMMEEALQAVAGKTDGVARVISIAAGISIAYIQRYLGESVRVVRVMPNTPALVHAGAAGIALAPNCAEEDGETAKIIFSAVGMAVMVEEKDIDAVTALSGSGPAYFFYMVECLVKAAAAEGLDLVTATRLAGQTLLGAGQLLQSSGESAEILREKVTSKGGTTEAALRSFRESGLEDTVRAAVSAAAARSRELGA